MMARPRSSHRLTRTPVSRVSSAHSAASDPSVMKSVIDTGLAGTAAAPGAALEGVALTGYLLSGAAGGRLQTCLSSAHSFANCSASGPVPPALPMTSSPRFMAAASSAW